MKPEVRDALGKAAYEALAAIRLPHNEAGEYEPAWEHIGEIAQEYYRIEASGVVEKLVEMFLPSLLHTLLSEAEIKDFVLHTLLSEEQIKDMVHDYYILHDF